MSEAQTVCCLLFLSSFLICFVISKDGKEKRKLDEKSRVNDYMLGCKGVTLDWCICNKNLFVKKYTTICHKGEDIAIFNTYLLLFCFMSVTFHSYSERESVGGFPFQRQKENDVYTSLFSKNKRLKNSLRILYRLRTSISHSNII